MAHVTLVWGFRGLGFRVEDNGRVDMWMMWAMTVLGFRVSRHGHGHGAAHDGLLAAVGC